MVKHVAIFMAEDNLCAQNLLKLVSRGNALIAELLRLKDHIPAVFCLDSKTGHQKYADVILDFSYFKISDAHEKKINDNLALQDLDDEIKENHLEIISRFYLAFDSIFQYITDLNLFLEQLSDGVFIQQTLETVVQDVEGKQLMCESLYLYGTMLLICDMHIQGKIRERLLVAFYRHSMSQTQTNIDEVCKLLRDSGFINSAKRPSNYPDEYFNRIPIDPTFLGVVIGRLRSEDIYNQISIYPQPEHRTTALSTQASMLFICLFFTPNILASETTKMREIVDKYFSDNWVISVYMGITLSLVDFWEPYKAAKQALMNTINAKTLKDLSVKYGADVKRLLSRTNNILKEGALKEEQLSDEVNGIINFLRECNVTLRWMMCHTCAANLQCDGHKKNKQMKDQVSSNSKLGTMDLLDLLINTAQLEYKIREMLRAMLESRSAAWDKYKQEAVERISELTELFSGGKESTKVTVNAHLGLWFGDLTAQMELLSLDAVNASTKKIAQMLQALEEVGEFHGLNATHTAKQLLLESSESLKSALRVASVKEEFLLTLEIVADVSYAWRIIDAFTPLMQESIRKDPSIAGRLRSVFLKLASAMEIPLLRINQSHSDDLISVSQYYSNQLVNYIRKVLQTIPEMVFGLLEKIINIQTFAIKELPTKVEKEKLREFAQLDQRMEVAKLTYSVSVFTGGILMMKTTLVGVVRLDPAELLQEGLQKELSTHIQKRFDSLFDNQQKSKLGASTDLQNRLQTLIESIDGYRRSLEYIQDYVNINGLRMWQEEVSRIISDSVVWESKHRGGLSLVEPAQTFMGKLARELLALGDPRSSSYVRQSTAWFDRKTSNETMNIKLFSKIYDALSVSGLHGLDRLFGFMIVNQLKILNRLITFYITRDTQWSQNLSSFLKELNPYTKNVPVKVYQQFIGKGSKIWAPMIEILLNVGSMQLLRRHIAHQLNTACKFDSNNLELSLHLMNDTLMKSVQENSQESTKPKPSAELIFHLEKYMNRAGLYDPFQKVYIKPGVKNSVTNPALVAFILSAASLQRLQYVNSADTLTSKTAVDAIDGHPLVVGLLTWLNQHPSDCHSQFIRLVCQYITSGIWQGLNTKYAKYTSESSLMLHLLDDYCWTSKTPASVIEELVPSMILASHQFLTEKSNS